MVGLSQFLIVAALLAAVWWLVAGRHIWNAEGDRIDGALPRLLNPCPYLDSTEPADDYIHNRPMCSGRAEDIRGRSDR